MESQAKWAAVNQDYYPQSSKKFPTVLAYSKLKEISHMLSKSHTYSRERLSKTSPSVNPTNKIFIEGLSKHAVWSRTLGYFRMETKQ